MFSIIPGITVFVVARFSRIRYLPWTAAVLAKLRICDGAARAEQERIRRLVISAPLSWRVAVAYVNER